MVKDPDSIYSPGRRGLGWLKMKKALATIDCVVVGVEVGHGKRHGVLSDYTFAVRDTANDRAGQHRQGVQRPDRRRDRRDDALVRGPHDRPVRALPPGRADASWSRSRFDVIVRSNAPRVRVLAALPADRPAAPGQVGRRDRHGRDGDRALRGPPARRRAPRDGRRETAPDRSAIVTDRFLIRPWVASPEFQRDAIRDRAFRSSVNVADPRRRQMARRESRNVGPGRA